MPTQTYHAELEYLKSITRAGPGQGPQLIFLLMAQYLNANQLEEGIEFFGTLLNQHKSQLPPMQRALYLSALGLLRASYADEVFLLKRIGWVNDTIDILEEARALSDNDIFVIRWSAGVVYAQLPARFDKREVAIEDLQWCVENISKAPHRGWLREAYYYLALLHHEAKDDAQAESYLQLSGYNTLDKTITLTTTFAVNAQTGFTFHPKVLKEILPDRIFALSGFEFTEYYFIVSEDGKELISIDAGTHPDSARAAYEYLKNQFPHLPELTTVFVTHTHWDHIGGHEYFRQLNPDVKFYVRDNYREEFDTVRKGSEGFSYFFGTRFNNALIADFRPDATISQLKELQVGGTRFELIPIPGGETVDGMFIYMPEHAVLFVGDFIMPYIGSPILEEGSLPGLLEAIDTIVALNPQHLLHGHEPLTRVWNSPVLLANLKRHLEWLYDETLKAIRGGMDRVTIHHQNLIPPFIDQYPDVQLIYLAMRENVINRLYDQHVGYWHPDMQGMDHLNHEEFGALLGHYLNLSDTQLARAIERMVNSGDHELAARTATWALTQYPSSEALREAKQLAFLRLKEKYQEFNPFKFIIYSEQIGHETPQLE